MTYNIHPILVHFPVALLFLYSIVKLLPFKRWFPNVSWKHVELALLIPGLLGAFAANITGEVAEHIARPNHKLVETHAFMALTATWMYGLLLAGELLYWINTNLVSKLRSAPILSFFVFIRNILVHPFVSGLLALLGLIAISLTGLLGGVMVYGVSADPLAGIVLQILGISI